MKNFNIATVFAVMAMTCCISSCSMADMDSSILGDTGMAQRQVRKEATRERSREARAETRRQER